jgi:hypothetical protein
LSEALDQLTEAEVTVLGAVINYVDITPTLNAEPELPPLIVPPSKETEEIKVEV